MFEMNRRVAVSDVGADAAMTVTAVTQFMQDCECFQLDSEPVLSAFFKRSCCGMYLASRQTDIVRLPVYGEEVTAKNRTDDYFSLRSFQQHSSVSLR